MWDKLDRVFKTLINKRTTDSTGKNYYNEIGDFTINVHNLEIWANPIDTVPADAVANGVVRYYDKLVLTEDITVPAQQCYYAVDSFGNRLPEWVSDKYGSGYTAKLFDANGAEIFPTNACGWFWDYQTGILTFTGSTSSFAKPFAIRGYKYIGMKGVTKEVDADTIKSKGLFLDVSPLIDPVSVETSFPMEVFLFDISVVCSGYHSGDYWELEFDTGGVIEKVCETMYTREIPEEMALGNLPTFAQRVAAGTIIRIVFYNNSGTSKKVWPAILYTYKKKGV